MSKETDAGNPIIEVAKDTVIYQQGQECNTMFLLRHGSVALYLNYGTPEQFQLCELSHEGASLGEMGLLNDEPRNATAVALTDCVLVEISDNQFPSFIAAHPAETRQIIIDLAVRFRNATNEIRNEQEVIRDCIQALQEEKHQRKESFAERLKRYADFFLEVPPDVPPDLYMSCYNRFHGSML